MISSSPSTKPPPDGWWLSKSCCGEWIGDSTATFELPPLPIVVMERNSRSDEVADGAPELVINELPEDESDVVEKPRCGGGRLGT